MMELSGFNVGTKELGINGSIRSDVFSLSSQGSQESSKNADLPVIYSGGNVSVTAKTKDLSIRSTGYYLDLADSSLDDGTFYHDIISDTSSGNIREIWNPSISYKPLTAYDTYTKDLAKSIKSEVSLQYYDGGTPFGEEKKNFKLKTSEPQVKNLKVAGAYNIVVAHGEVVENKAFYALCTDMARQYYGVTDGANLYKEGKKLFESSQVGQQLKSAIMSDSAENSGNNTSKDKDGNAWYDEVVRTFAVRKFTADIQLGDILVEDKIPLQEGSGSSSGSLVGRWKYTITIGDKDKTGLHGKYEFHIDNSDFVVSSETSNDIIR